MPAIFRQAIITTINPVQGIDLLVKHRSSCWTLEASHGPCIVAMQTGQSMPVVSVLFVTMRACWPTYEAQGGKLPAGQIQYCCCCYCPLHARRFFQQCRSRSCRCTCTWLQLLFSIGSWILHPVCVAPGQLVLSSKMLVKPRQRKEHALQCMWPRFQMVKQATSIKAACTAMHVAPQCRSMVHQKTSTDRLAGACT